jgi:hypothetical protein
LSEKTCPISPEPHFINYLKHLSGEIGFPVVDLNQLMAPDAANELLSSIETAPTGTIAGIKYVAELLSRSAFR